MKTDTPRQTDKRTNRALLEATLNLTFLKEKKVGNVEIINNETRKTHTIINRGKFEISALIANRLRMKSKPSGINTSPAAAGAGTPVK